MNLCNLQAVGFLGRPIRSFCAYAGTDRNLHNAQIIRQSVNDKETLTEPARCSIVPKRSAALESEVNPSLDRSNVGQIFQSQARALLYASLVALVSGCATPKKDIVDQLLEIAQSVDLFDFYNVNRELGGFLQKAKQKPPSLFQAFEAASGSALPKTLVEYLVAEDPSIPMVDRRAVLELRNLNTYKCYPASQLQSTLDRKFNRALSANPNTRVWIALKTPAIMNTVNLEDVKGPTDCVRWLYIVSKHIMWR